MFCDSFIMMKWAPFFGEVYLRRPRARGLFMIIINRHILVFLGAHLRTCDLSAERATDSERPPRRRREPYMVR